jgi:hypothetical protein
MGQRVARQRRGPVRGRGYPLASASRLTDRPKFSQQLPPIDTEFATLKKILEDH